MKSICFSVKVFDGKATALLLPPAWTDCSPCAKATQDLFNVSMLMRETRQHALG